MSDIRDFALWRSKHGNLELIPMQVEDADSAEPMALKGRAGALLVDVKNTDPIPVDLPADKVVDVEIQNADPIPILLQYPWGAGNEDWKPRRGTATIAISGTTSDTQVGYGKDLLRIKIPAEFTGTAIAVEVASASDETPAGIKTDNKIVVSIPIEAGDKGLWIGMDAFAAVLRGLSYFRLVSNDTEVAARAILYELG